MVMCPPRERDEPSTMSHLGHSTLLEFLPLGAQQSKGAKVSWLPGLGEVVSSMQLAGLGDSASEWCLGVRQFELVLGLGVARALALAGSRYLV